MRFINFNILFNKIRYFFSSYFHSFSIKKLLKFIPVIILLIGAFFAYKHFNRKTARTSSFYGKKEIVVGVAAPTPFTEIDSDGNMSGFEIDFINELLDRTYPESEIRLKNIESQQASYLLKTGDIDIAIGMFTGGPLKTQGLSISKGYYYDTVNIFCDKDSTITTLIGLTNKKIRVLSSEITKSSVSSMFKSLSINVDLHLCSSYPDAIESITSGETIGIASPKQKLKAYDELKMLDEAIGECSYSLMLWKSHSDVTAILNTTISQMASDGTLKALRDKWGLN